MNQADSEAAFKCVHIIKKTINIYTHILNQFPGNSINRDWTPTPTFAASTSLGSVYFNGEVVPSGNSALHGVVDSSGNSALYAASPLASDIGGS